MRRNGSNWLERRLRGRGLDEWRRCAVFKGMNQAIATALTVVVTADHQTQQAGAEKE